MYVGLNSWEAPLAPLNSLAYSDQAKAMTMAAFSRPRVGSATSPFSNRSHYINIESSPSDFEIRHDNNFENE
jgi:hypothetical protein